MVETSLRPRPGFHTFLHADSPREGDALTYYDYQRALRANKVEILQQRRAVTYEPGYRKPYAEHPSKATRKIFQLKSIQPPPPSAQYVKSPLLVEPANELLHGSASPAPVATGVSPVVDMCSNGDSNTSLGAEGERTSGEGRYMENLAGLTDRLPKIYKQRLVKSATARTSGLVSASAVASHPEIPQRPKTAASIREFQAQTTPPHDGKQFLLTTTNLKVLALPFTCTFHIIIIIPVHDDELTACIHE
jgi:hypothetical protein